MPVRAALVRSAIVPLHTEPRVSSTQTSQALFGEMLVVLDAAGDWTRVRCVRDGYEGWVHPGYLDVLDPPGFDALVAAEPEVFGAYDVRTWSAGEAPPADVSAGGLSEALGGADQVPRLSLGCEVRGYDGSRLRLPVGATVHADVEVTAGDVVPIGDTSRFPSGPAAVVATARAFFEGTSYQWGGITPWGADCSGFVQTTHALHGVALPRDASQQARVGADAGVDLAAHTAGDLLFFSDREDGGVTHVGIAAGGGRMLHVALGRGGFADDDLAGGDDPYLAAMRARFVGARRVLG